ncbi:MAG: GntR family transcriptional regulator [Glaciecola sp.]|jgi:GntR family transcriptional regulator
MDITISLKDGIPIYRQIANQIRYMVASGILVPGEEISPIRALALTLSITPNTVVKAYAELEASAVIYKRRGAGTYISDERSPLAEQEKCKIIESRIDALLAEAQQLNFTEEELLRILKDRQTMMNGKNGKRAKEKNND